MFQNGTSKTKLLGFRLCLMFSIERGNGDGTSRPPKNNTYIVESKRIERKHLEGLAYCFHCCCFRECNCLASSISQQFLGSFTAFPGSTVCLKRFSYYERNLLVASFSVSSRLVLIFFLWSLELKVQLTTLSWQSEHIMEYDVTFVRD